MRRENMMQMSLPRRRYTSARSGLLTMMIFTVVNIALGSLGSFTYFVFSDYAAYMSALLGRQFYDLRGEVIYLVLGIGLALLILIPYLVCWMLSKKRRSWLIVAFVLFLIDTIMLAVDALSYMEAGYLLDIAFHIWLLVSLFLGIRAGKKALAEEAAPAVAEDTEFYDASTGAVPDSKSLGAPQEERKYRVLVEAQYGGRTIQVRRSYGLTELVVDGRLYGTWEGVSEHPYTITAQVDGHTIATSLTALGKQTIEADGEVIAKKQRLI